MSEKPSPDSGKPRSRLGDWLKGPITRRDALITGGSLVGAMVVGIGALGRVLSSEGDRRAKEMGIQRLVEDEYTRFVEQYQHVLGKGELADVSVETEVLRIEGPTHIRVSVSRAHPNGESREELGEFDIVLEDGQQYDPKEQFDKHLLDILRPEV